MPEPRELSPRFQVSDNKQAELLATLPPAWHQRHRDFYAQTASSWNHSHLLEIAAVTLQQDGAKALERLREQLEKLGPGYHATLTGCWLALIQLAFQEKLSAEETARRLSFSQLPLAFYSPGRLQSAEAAERHLAPDLGPVALPLELPPEWAETLVAFQSRRLAKEKWDHSCHLRVAAGIYLLLGEPGAYVMSVGIQRLNQAHGVPLTPTGGYHETLTRLWFYLVARAVDRFGLVRQPDSPELLQRMLECLEDRNLPLHFYTRERLMSWEARIGWLEPDLQSLERVDFV